MRTKPLVILLVEDNPSHAELVIRSFEDHQIPSRICHVADGEEALDFLFQRGPFIDPEEHPRPQVILLDLRIPKIDGLSVLKVIKTTEKLKDIPVVILTTSAAETDLARAYSNHANSYLVKPVDFDKFTKLMNELGLYWLVSNQRPDRHLLRDKPE